MEPRNWMWVAQLGRMYAFRLSGITGLNQNGLPVAVDPAKAQTKEVADLKAKLLASRDTELLGMVAAALGGQGAIAGAMARPAHEPTA